MLHEPVMQLWPWCKFETSLQIRCEIVGVEVKVSIENMISIGVRSLIIIEKKKRRCCVE